MNIDGLEMLRLSDLKELYNNHKLTLKEALPVMREFRDKHGLTDKEALRANGIAKRIFGN